MHLEQLWIENARDLVDSEWGFAASKDAIRKWTVFAREESPEALFGLVAVACAGKRQREALPQLLPPLAPRNGGPVRVEFRLVRQAPQECAPHQPPRASGGWQIGADGSLAPLPKREARHVSAAARFGSPHLGSGNAGWLLLGYGAAPRTHDGTDAFDFRDPQHRLKRFASCRSRRAGPGW